MRLRNTLVSDFHLSRKRKLVVMERRNNKRRSSRGKKDVRATGYRCRGSFLVLVTVLVIQAPVLSARTSQEQEHADTPRTTRQQGGEQKGGVYLPPRVASLLYLARTAAAEFRADALLRIATSGLVSDQRLRTELLDEAFESAGRAGFQIKKVHYDALDRDSRIGYLEMSYELNLDATSLRCRIVNAFIDIDRIHAKDLFSQIPIKDALGKPLTCEDALVFDVTTYYETAKRIAEGCFDKKEIHDGDRTRFFEDMVNDATSVAQLGPVAHLIAAASVDSYELQSLIHIFSAVLARVPRDYRMFRASQGVYRLADSFYELKQASARQSIPTGELMSAYRSLLIRQLSGRGCADVPENERRFSAFVRAANKGLFPSDPINPEEIRVGDVEAGPPEFLYWTLPKAIQALEGVRGLRFDPKGEEWSAAEKQTLQWRDKYRAVINLLDDWSATDEKTEEDYLHQKAVILGDLVRLAPSDTVREEVLLLYLFFLRNMSSDRVNQVEWFMHMAEVIETIRDNNGKARVKAFDLLTTSKVPIMELYAALSIEGLSDRATLKKFK